MMALWMGKAQEVEQDQCGKMGLILCPFHMEKTPSFILDYTEKTFRCCGCGMKGTFTGEEAPNRIFTTLKGEVANG